MSRLVRAELLKLRTTQVWFWMLLLAVVAGALVVIGGRRRAGTARLGARAGTGGRRIFHEPRHHVRKQ
jgi:hypothetical protein